MAKTIAVLSLKGGVGKTSSVISLGDALADFGKKVLLVDGNLSSPNLGLHLDILDNETTLHHVLSRKSNITDAILKMEKFDVLPASVFPEFRTQPFQLKNRLRQVADSYDIILIDSSPAMNAETISAMIASDSLIVVTTPDYPTLNMTVKAVSIAKERGTPILGLILNKVYSKNFELSLDEIEKSSEVPILAVIPHDTSVLRALYEAVPYTSYKPKSKGSEEYRKLAGVLIGEKYKPKRFVNIFRFVPSRQEINREIFYERIFE